MKLIYNSGFSLIEVLVAFSIAAVSLGIIFNIYAKGTSAAILGEEYAHAIAIAESRLAGLGIAEEIRSTEMDGKEGDKYEWRIQINDYLEESESDFESVMELKEIEIEVIWESRGKTRTVNLQTLKPEFSL